MSDRPGCFGIFWVLALLLGVAFWAGVIFVVLHFVLKFW